MFFIAYLFATSGISIIITSSTIFKKFRNFVEQRSPFFGEGINCPLCMGFWAGIFLSLWGISPAHLYIYPECMSLFINDKIVYYFIFILNGCISSMLSWGFYNLIEFMQHKHVYDYLEKEIMKD